MTDYLSVSYYGNPLIQWGIALLVALGALGLGFLLRRLLVAQLRRVTEKTSTEFDDVAADVIAATRGWFLFVMAIWAGTLMVVLPEIMRLRFTRLVALAALLQIGLWAGAAIRGYVDGVTRKRLDQDPASISTVRALGFLLTMVVWAAVLLVALDNLGVEVTAMIAGLGIGGVAVALALQNILGDLFASLSIVLDKPFAYGDFVIVDDMLGTVEKIGLKTTRIRSLSGEQLVFSNSDLLQSRIRNYKRMFERRVVFSMSVARDTPRQQLAAVSRMLQEAVEDQEDVRFDRAHFFKFGTYSLDYEVVYYVLSPDYNVYMDRQQAINLHIMESLEQHGIEIAYPTRAVHLQGAVGAAS